VGRSKSRRQKDREREKAAKAIRVEALKKEKENGITTSGGRTGRIDA
jgi:hypothetical protein